MAGLFNGLAIVEQGVPAPPQVNVARVRAEHRRCALRDLLAIEVQLDPGFDALLLGPQDQGGVMPGEKKGTSYIRRRTSKGGEKGDIVH
jgi:hypothetical protein